uniref:Uncharacterized protein n=1 Tax=Anopheles albimanus TaxID=7167 RepID=A0A182FWR8_ANOAL
MHTPLCREAVVSEMKGNHTPNRTSSDGRAPVCMLRFDCNFRFFRLADRCRIPPLSPNIIIIHCGEEKRNEFRFSPKRHASEPY